MAEPWIRVHANISEKRVAIRASDQLKVSINEAIGLLVRFWGAMSRLGDDGLASRLTDREIESWAGWRGKRGAFAQFVREQHIDTEGRVNEWDEYAGKLEDRRAKDRERQKHRRELRRTSRGQSAERHAERQRDVTHESVPARAVRNETKRNETIYQSIDPGAVDVETVIAEPLRDAQRFALRSIVGGANSDVACLASLAAMVSGNDPAIAQPTVAQFGQALLDYSANGERWNAAHFRGYLKRTTKPDVDDSSPPRGSANGQPANGKPRSPRGAERFGGARNDAAIDAWLADKERERAEAEAVEPEPEEIPHGE